MIDNLSHLNFARDYIIKLRLLYSDDIDVTELENKISKTEKKIEGDNSKIDNLPLVKFISKRVAIIQLRQKRDQDLRGKFLVLRERNSVYRTKNDFYIFYNKIIQLDSEILDNAIYINNLTEGYENLHDLEFRAKYEEVKPIIFFQKVDNISTEIDNIILNLESKYRIKRSHF